MYLGINAFALSGRTNDNTIKYPGCRVACPGYTESSTHCSIATIFMAHISKTSRLSSLTAGLWIVIPK